MNNSKKNPRQPRPLAMAFAAALFAAACATTAPVELQNARATYNRASSGPAAQHTPADLHKAKVALDKAEQSFVEGEDSRKTTDLAYIADRMARIAEVRAEAAIAEEKTAKANQEFGQKQGEMAKATKQALADTREQLTDAEHAQQQQAQQTGIERNARVDAEAKAAASEQKAVLSDEEARKANEALAKLAAKEEARGMVITLSGSVLFRSNESMLLPGAQARLNQVAEALVARGRDVVIEGHTDSRGSQSSNVVLSQRRAESVRTYLVGRGFPAEQILAQGMGPDRPIADNASSEGRANNRRVEIVIAKAN